MSDDFVGGSGSGGSSGGSFGGSSSGGSSDSVSGASSSGLSGGSSALTQSILSSVTQLGSSQLLGGSRPSVSVPTQSAPVTKPTAVTSMGSSGTTTWIVVAGLILVGIFAFREL